MEISLFNYPKQLTASVFPIVSMSFMVSFVSFCLNLWTDCVVLFENCKSTLEQISFMMEAELRFHHHLTSIHILSWRMRGSLGSILVLISTTTCSLCSTQVVVKYIVALSIYIFFSLFLTVVKNNNFTSVLLHLLKRVHLIVEKVPNFLMKS